MVNITETALTKIGLRHALVLHTSPAEPFPFPASSNQLSPIVHESFPELALIVLMFSFHNKERVTDGIFSATETVFSEQECRTREGTGPNRLRGK